MKPTFEERLAVYKRAKEIVEKGNNHFGLQYNHLCWLLPCLFFKVKYFDDDIGNGKRIKQTKTPELFPEFHRYFNYDRDDIFGHYLIHTELVESLVASKQWRLKVLSEIISDMEKTLNK